MKFDHKKFISILHAHSFGLGIIAVFVAFFIFAGGFVAANGQPLEPIDSHVVSLYMDGVESTIPTRALTVGDFVQKMDLKLSEYDLIEPALSTSIDSDDFRIRIYSAKPVTIIEGSNIKRMMSPYSEPRTILEKSGIKTYPEDILNITSPTSIVNEMILGQKIEVDRAVPISLSLYGSPPAQYRTHAKTVEDFLAEKNIVPETGATVLPNKDAVISENLPIFVSKIGKKVVSQEEEIAFSTNYRRDENKPIGYKEIITAGIKGKKQVIYELEIRDGMETGRRVLQEAIIKEPVMQDVIIGTKITGFSGDFAAALAKLRSCEGAYTSNTGNGYYGAYQFNLGTWRANAPAGYENMLPSEAPPEVQDQAAATLYQRRGWQPWPACSRSLGLLDIYR